MSLYLNCPRSFISFPIPMRDRLLFLLFLSSTVSTAKHLSEDELQRDSPIIISVAETESITSPINQQSKIKTSVVLPGNNFENLPEGMLPAIYSEKFQIKFP